MKAGLPRLSPESIVAEVEDVSLGDERLDRRYIEVMTALAGAPSASFAAMCPTPADLEALYRFMRNDAVDWRDLLEPHIEQSCERSRQAGAVLVVHDSTKIRVAQDSALESYLNTGKRGFLAHAAVVLDATETRRPLGLAGLRLLTRKERKAKTRRNGRTLSGAETAKLKNKEYDRWFALVEQSAERLSGVDVVHVMDREADSYELLARMTARGDKFVVRWCRDRRAKDAADEDAQWSSVRELLQTATSIPFVREVHVSRRDAQTAPAAAKANPQREARTARLRFARCSIKFRKPAWLPVTDQVPEELEVNVVHVFEPAPPDGAEPIEWVLLTNLSIKRPEDVERVVDIYRQRWLIEEFFKALKTGCGYRERRLTNRQSIFNTLVSFIPIAWKALLLRQMAQAPTRTARDVLSKLELTVLRAKARQMGWKLPAHPKASDVLALIARLGGHRGSSGPPGWRALMKGTDRFTGMVDGWSLARAGDAKM